VATAGTIIFAICAYLAIRRFNSWKGTAKDSGNNQALMELGKLIFKKSKWCLFFSISASNFDANHLFA